MCKGKGSLGKCSVIVEVHFVTFIKQECKVITLPSCLHGLLTLGQYEAMMPPC